MVSKETHEIIYDEDKNVISDGNGNIMLYDKKNNTIVYEPVQIVANVFEINVNVLAEVRQCDDPVEGSFSEVDEGDDKGLRTVWTRKEILGLIDAYKKHENLLKSSTIKNERVWQMISKNVPCHTTEQCRNKFKYLKSKYLKKKDNMSSKRTGDPKMTFEYFNEMESIFGKCPNVVPLGIASSSAESSTEAATSDNESEPKVSVDKDNIVEKKKLKQKEKLSSSEKVKEELKQLQSAINERERNVERRHQENMDIKKKALDAFTTVMQKLLDDNK